MRAALSLVNGRLGVDVCRYYAGCICRVGRRCQVRHARSAHCMPLNSCDFNCDRAAYPLHPKTHDAVDAPDMHVHGCIMYVVISLCQSRKCISNSTFGVWSRLFHSGHLHLLTDTLMPCRRRCSLSKSSEYVPHSQPPAWLVHRPYLLPPSPSTPTLCTHGREMVAVRA